MTGGMRQIHQSLTDIQQDAITARALEALQEDIRTNSYHFTTLTLRYQYFDTMIQYLLEQISALIIVFLSVIIIKVNSHLN